MLSSWRGGFGCEGCVNRNGAAGGGKELRLGAVAREIFQCVILLKPRPACGERSDRIEDGIRVRRTLHESNARRQRLTPTLSARIAGRGGEHHRATGNAEADGSARGPRIFASDSA